MPISHYPRVGERLAPQALSDILDVRVCDSVRVGQLPARIRFNQLDESVWERTTSHHCEELAQALIEIVRLSLPQMLEQCGDRKLPLLPVGTTLDDLSVSIRTHNCLDKVYANDLRGFRKATFSDVLGLYAFGMRSLVDLLVAIETVAAVSPAVTTLDVAFVGDDERAAANFYVAQLIHRYPTAQRKLQTSLDYQLSQYNNFYHKGIWVSQARASFNAKVKNESGFPTAFPSWPSSQLALGFAQEPKPETTLRELFETETQTEELTESDDNRVLEHVAQVADVLNAVDEQSDHFRASSHRLAALVHSVFEPEAAIQELEKMRLAIQSLTGIVATWEEFASSLQKGKRLTSQPDAEVLALVANIVSVAGATDIRCDDPRFGGFVSRLKSQAQILGEALQAAQEESCQPHSVFELQQCLRELQSALKSCCALTVEEELQSLVNSFLALSSTRLSTPRQEELCSRRYGWDGHGGATLQEIALEIGVSRERVRQICRPAEQALDLLAELKPFAPALKRCLHFAAERAPITRQEIENELHIARITKGKLSVRRLLRITKWLGVTSPLAISQVGGQADGQMMVVRVADQNDEAEKNEVNGILIKVRKAATRWGVANVEEIVANIAESFGDDSYFNAQQIINVVKTQPDFAWLDEGSGWFWFAETPRNGLVSQIDKALSVAPSLRVADLRAAVSRHHRRRGFAPPQRVLLELCRQCGFKVNEGIVHAKSDLDSLDALSETEWLMAEVLKDHGPLMKRVDFEKHCKDLKIPRGTFYTYLNHSPVLHKYARGVYGLPGVDVVPGEVETLAPDSRDGRRQVLRDYGWLESGEAWTGYRVSSHMLKQGTCGVPAAMQPHIYGRFALRSADDTPFGSLTCKDYYGNGLGSFFRRRGAEEGDFLIIVFDLQNQEATLHLGDENLLESYQSPTETELESETDEIFSSGPLYTILNLRQA